MALGIGDISATQEKIIEQYLQDNLPKESILMDNVKRNDRVRAFNNNFYAPIRSQRNGGVVNLSTDKSKLVTSNSQRVQASIGVKIVTGTYDISDLVKKVSANDKLAIVNEMTQQAEDLKVDMGRQINRQYYSDGYGIVAQVSGSVSGSAASFKLVNTSVDDTRGSTDSFGYVNGDLSPVDAIVPDQVLGLGTSLTGIGTVSSVSYTGGSLGTVTFTGTLASTADNAVYILDGNSTGAGTSEIQGLRAAINSGTASYAGLARTLEVWKPKVDTTSEALSLNRMQLIYLQARKYAQKGDQYIWICNQTLFNKFGNILTALRRTVDSMQLASGWSGIEFQLGANGDGKKIGVFLDYQCPDGYMFLVNLDTWTVCQVADMGFVEDSALRRSDYITFQKVISWYTNLLNVAPAANGALVQKTG